MNFENFDILGLDSNHMEDYDYSIDNFRESERSNSPNFNFN